MSSAASLPEYLLHLLRPARAREEWRRIREKFTARLRPAQRGMVAMQPEGVERGRVLLSYILDPFLAPDDIDYSHTHFWETMTIARTWLEAGYGVDAVSWTDDVFMPERYYDVVIDVRMNLERWAPYLSRSTLKILHADTSHFTFNNPAQQERLDALRARRGRGIKPVKMLPENRALECCDVLTVLGNGFTQGTYAFAGKPIHHVPVSVPFAYDWPEGKDFDAVRRNFLWFGSGGLVHKGLDLVLEAFAGMPDFHLTVCGPIGRERDFEREYFHELYRTPNIHTHGWIDVGSSEFEALARNCLALAYPSCAEGGGASALTCLHAALIPVVTRETSIDVTPDYGVVLEKASVEAIRDSVAELASRPTSELESMARNGRDWVRGRHSKERFQASYREVVARLVAERLDSGSGAASGAASGRSTGSR